MDLLSLRDAARRLNISYQTAYRLVRDGRFPGDVYRLGGRGKYLVQIDPQRLSRVSLSSRTIDMRQPDAHADVCAALRDPTIATIVLVHPDAVMLQAIPYIEAVLSSQRRTLVVQRDDDSRLESGPVGGELPVEA